MNDGALPSSRDPNTVVKRGRGLSTSSSVQRQRSGQGSSARAQTFTDNGLPPQIPQLRRSPSASQSNSPHGPRSHSTSRSLSRSQSNVSLFQSTPSSPATEAFMHESFPLRDGATALRKDAVPFGNGVRLHTRPPASSETPSPALSRSTSSAKLHNLRVETTRTPLPAQAAPEQASVVHGQNTPVQSAVPTSTQSDSLSARPVPVLDLILDDLFRAFANQADTKIDNCADSRLRIASRIEDICGTGVDSSFDQLLKNMGFVARSNPRALIDRVMAWKRQHDSGKAPVSTQKAPATGTDTIKRSVDITKAAPESRSVSVASNRTNVNMPAYSPEAELVERRSSAATYILCRALIEALSQTSLDALTKQLAVLLEEIAFEFTVNKITRDEMQRSSMQRAKWAKAVELLGVLSVLDFGGVVGRYNRELKVHQATLADKGGSNINVERKAYNLLRGLRALRPRADSETSWFQISAGVQSLVDLFLGVHGEHAKIEYCLTIGALLLRTASSSQSMYDDQKWRKMINDLHTRLVRMSSKPKYWPTTYPTQVALACVSPNDVFQVRWQQMLDTTAKYVRERHSRLPALKSACRMTWCYLHRKYDNEGIMVRSIEDLARVIFFSGRKYSLSREPDTIETLIQLIRIVGSMLPSTCFRSIIFPLMGADGILSAKDTNIQGLDPDRIVIGIRSFLALIGDMEKNTKPSFPLRLGEEEEQADDGFQAPGSPGAVPKNRPRKASLIKGERLSEPVATGALSDVVRQHYHTFCEVLGKLIRICDNAFGGQASLDEKFATPTAKTPLSDAWNFARREELIQNDDARLVFYDLLHVAVQALPRCLSSKQPPANELTNLLCTGTAHVEKDIAMSSAASLKSIARQGWAQEVVDRFSAFIFKYENRYATMSDGGLLGTAHIESTLRLYIELLNVWVEELQKKRNNQALGIPRLDVSTSQSYVDRVEAQGLFFLCSPSNRVRSFAVEVFELVTKLDSALGETNARLLDVFGSVSPPILDSSDTAFTFKERAHLGRGMKKGNVNGEILDLCRSSDREEAALWVKVFPHVIKAASAHCYMTVSQTREDVCSRLSHLQAIIEAPREERQRAATVSTVDSASSRGAGRGPPLPNDITIDQWKLYLIFACSTITRLEPVSASGMDPGHTRQGSRSSQHGSEAMTNAADLLSNVVPLLFSDHPRIRAAAVTGLGSVNIIIYKPLLESLSRATRRQGGDLRKQGNHARNTSSPRRDWSGSVYYIEVVQVYESTSQFIQDTNMCNDVSVLDHLANVTRELSMFLARDANAHSLTMKSHFCGLIERFYLGLTRTADPSRWMSFQTRKAAYVQLENWWDETLPGESISQVHVREVQSLRFATSSAMAALCAGPLHLKSNGVVVDQFQPSRILGLIDMMLKSEGDRIKNAGKRALKNLINHNRQLPELFESTVDKLYEATKSTTLESYLEVLIDVSGSAETPANLHWKMISILLFTVGSVNERIRMKSLKLLRTLEEHLGNSARLRNFDIRVSDKTRAVHVAAQYNLVEEIILKHEEYAYSIFSEYSKHFIDLPVDSQRSMIHIMLPWMKQMDLQVDQQGQPTPTTHMVLLNMLLITVKCETKLHHELQALWHGLIDGKFAGNAKAIIDFVIHLALESKNEAFIKTARQITVYMASHEGGKGVYDYLLAHVDPKAMRGDEMRKVIHIQSSTGDNLFTAPLSQILENSTSHISLSSGQLSLILLVDLIVERYIVPLDKVPLLLQAVLVLWDHHLPIVQDSAREMLVHLIHVLVISKVDKTVFDSRHTSVEELVDLIRRHDSKVVWDYNNNMNQFTPYELPTSMSYVISETVSLFSITMPGIAQTLGFTAVTWATNCVVRHQACRSWQIYRCLLTRLTPSLMSTMLFQMSGTVSDPHDDVQAYAMDIIRVFRTIAERQSGENALITQVFWAVCGLLYTIHEHEFREAIHILGVILEKCDMRDPDVVQRFLAAKPENFDASFPGVASFVYSGCRSIYSCDDTLVMLDRLLQVGSSPLVGDESRLRLTLLANIPRFLHSFENPTVRTDCLQAATTIHDVCYARGLIDMAHTLDQFQSAQFRDKEEFLSNWAYGAQEILEPDTVMSSFIFAMGMLHNQLPWMRWETLRLLEFMVPFLQPLNKELACYGPGLFTPLLALMQTEYCGEALRILDRILPPIMQVPQEQRQQSTVTAAATGSEGPLRLQDEHDPYGQPGRTGWSVPNPVNRRRTCRKNLEALHAATLAEGPTDDPQQVTPGIEFQQEFFPAQPETTIGELTAELDDMDDFFEVASDVGAESISDDSLTPSAHLDVPYESKERPRFLPSPSGSQQNIPMAKRRDGSANSIGGYTSESSPSSLRPAAGVGNNDPHIMSPSAFAAPPVSHTRLPSRPSILSRSVTMPVSEGLDTMSSHRPDTVPSSPEGESFSDDEALRPFWRSPHNPEAHDGSGTIRPDTSTNRPRFGLRSLSLKRLTSNAGERHRRAQTAGAVRVPNDADSSPQVPKVPDEYLTNPQSSDM